jgi:hypothetical protein
MILLSCRRRLCSGVAGRLLLVALVVPAITQGPAFVLMKATSTDTTITRIRLGTRCISRLKSLNGTVPSGGPRLGVATGTIVQ